MYDSLLNYFEKKTLALANVLKLKNFYALYFHTKRSIVRSVLSKTEADIIHLHWVDEGMINFKELGQLKKPIVWTMHDSNPFTGYCHIPNNCIRFENKCGKCPKLNSLDENDLSNKVIAHKNRYYKQLDLHLVSPSNWLANCARKSSLLKGYNIHVIPNGIDTKIFYPKKKSTAKKELGLNPSTRYILFGTVSVKDPNKGFQFIEDMVTKYVSKENNKNIEFLIFGSNYIGSSINLPIKNFGYIDDEDLLSTIYSACEFSIVPSISENLCSTIIESMACETPVLAFNIGGNSDIIDHKENGYLAREHDVEDLYKGFGFLLESSSVMLTSCREKIMNKFDINKTTSEYLKLYKSIL